MDYQMDFNFDNLTTEEAHVLSSVLMPAYAARNGNPGGEAYAAEIAEAVPGLRSLGEKQMGFLVSVTNGARMSYDSWLRLANSPHKELFTDQMGFLTQPNKSLGMRCCVWSYAFTRPKMLNSAKPATANSISVADLYEAERNALVEQKRLMDAMAKIIIAGLTQNEKGIVVTEGELANITTYLENKDAFTKYVSLKQDIGNRRIYIESSPKKSGNSEDGVILRMVPKRKGEKFNLAEVEDAFTEPISMSALKCFSLLFQNSDAIADYVYAEYEGSRSELFDIECEIYEEMCYYVAQIAYPAHSSTIPKPSHWSPITKVVETPKTIAEALPKTVKQKEKKVENIEAPKLKGVTVVEEPKEEEIIEADNPNEGLTPQDIILTAVGKDEQLYEAVIQFFEDNDMPLKEAAELTAADIQEYAKLATEDKEEVLELEIPVEAEAEQEAEAEPEVLAEAEVEAEAASAAPITQESLNELFGQFSSKNKK